MVKISKKNKAEKRFCRGKTQKNKPCKRKPLFYYCSYHWKKLILSWKFFLAGFFGSLLYIGGFRSDVLLPLFDWVFPENYEVCKQDGNIRGIILNNVGDVKKIKIQCSLSSKGLEYAGTYIENQENCFMPIVSMTKRGDKYVNEGKIEPNCSPTYRITPDGKLMISAKIWDAQGCLVAQIVENKFVLNKNCEYTWNMDKTGFEVVDGNFEVIFSMDFRPPDLIAVQGIFYDNQMGAQVIGCRDRNLCPMGFEISGNHDGIALVERGDWEKIRKTKKTIKPLFKYIGKDWFGKRES